MNWITKAFIQGALIGLFIAVIATAASGGKTFSRAVDTYGSILLMGGIFLVLWLGIANVISIAFERRKSRKLDQQ